MAARRVVILGAGISGLSIAWGLTESGGRDCSVTVLEASQNGGGLARTIERNGVRFDIGPHRLSPQLPGIVEKIKELLGDELREMPNSHGVYFHQTLYRYPPRIMDFLSVGSLRNTARFGLSWLAARFGSAARAMIGVPRDKTFESMLLHAFGRTFCEEVIFPMIMKVWGTQDLHHDFARVRFELPTFSRMLKKVITSGGRKDGGTFYYPAKGFGQIYDAMALLVSRRGQRIIYSAAISRIDAASLSGPFRVWYKTGTDEYSIEADTLVSTISNRDLLRYLSGTGLVDPLLPLSNHFVSRTMWLGVLSVRNFKLPSRIVIFPEQQFIFNRISDMSSFTGEYPKDASLYLVDVVCDPESGHDRMSEPAFNAILLDSLLTLGWFKREDVTDLFSVRFPNAYPVLDHRRYEAQERIDRAFESTSVVLCGREASSDYNNAHNAIGKGFLAARYLAGELEETGYRKASRTIGRLPIED